LKPYVVGLLVVVAILAGFYGGYKVGHSNVSASTNTQTPTARAGNGFGGTRGLGAACPSPGATPSAGTRAVTIVGTRQADGSILAQTIQIGSGTLGGGPGTNGPGTTGG
jgi:hypothetical protein